MASVGNDSVEHANHYMSQTTRRVPYFFSFLLFGGRSQLAVELDHLFVRGGERLLRTRGMIVSRSVYMVVNPRGSYVVYPLLSLEMFTPEIKLTH